MVIGWLLAGSLRLTLPRTRSEKVVRHGLPVLLALLAIPVLYLAVARHAPAAGLATLSLAALGASLYARARAFGTRRVPKLWHNLGRLAGLASAASLLAVVALGPGAGGLMLMALLLLLTAVVMGWSFGSLEALIQRAGHPDRSESGPAPAEAETHRPTAPSPPDDVEPEPTPDRPGTQSVPAPTPVHQV